ncbi:MAG: [FeFe] hydrogenase H-cluster radical SAM maturase HydE, partial [Acutalibacteraceae bacterium]
GGEDMHYTDDDFVSIIGEIKSRYPDCAVTLSIGERSREAYQRYFEAGADRYLLRHETADCDHYKRLHPDKMSFENRMRCIKDLKDIGFQTGIGFMVGSPYQTEESIYKDLQLIKEIQPHMVGIGPFIPHKDTPFADFKAGSCDLTLKLLAIIRLIKPNVLLPATTALGTIDPRGREKGILAGANVVMPNLSPVIHRKDYSLYDNKICTGEEAAECRFCLSRRVESIGYELVTDKGDCAAAPQS